MRTAIVIIFTIFLAGCEPGDELATLGAKLENPNGSITTMDGIILRVTAEETMQANLMIFVCENPEDVDSYCCYGALETSITNKYNIPILCGTAETLGGHLDKLETTFGYLVNFNNSLTDGELSMTLTPYSVGDNITGLGVGKLSDGSKVKVIVKENLPGFGVDELSDRPKPNVVIRDYTKN